MADEPKTPPDPLWGPDALLDAVTPTEETGDVTPPDSVLFVNPEHPAVVEALKVIADQSAQLYQLAIKHAKLVAKGAEDWTQREMQDFDAAVRGRVRRILQGLDGLPRA